MTTHIDLPVYRGNAGTVTMPEGTDYENFKAMLRKGQSNFFETPADGGPWHQIQIVTGSAFGGGEMSTSFSFDKNTGAFVNTMAYD